MADSCCSGGGKKTVLLFACSGGANVGEMSDRVARQLMKEGHGTMFCVAGLGAGIQEMIQTAKSADLNVVLEGCPLDCAKKIFDNLGLKNYVQVRATDLGIEKKKGVPVKDEELAKVVAKAREALAKA